MAKLSKENLNTLAWAATSFNDVVRRYFDSVMRIEIMEDLGYDFITDSVHIELEEMRFTNGGHYFLIGWSVTNFKDSSLNLPKEGFGYKKDEFLKILDEWLNGEG